MILLFILALCLSYYHPFLVVEAQFVDNVVDHHHHHHSISKWNTLDAALLVFLLISIYCIACRYFDVYGRRSGSILTQETAGQDHDVGLDRCIVEGFPVFAYSDVSGLGLEKVPLECAVCLGQFEKDEKLCMLPKCEHMFHLECVDRWLAGHTTCPLCRAELAARPDRLIKEDPNRVHLSRSGSSGTVGDTIINIA